MRGQAVSIMGAVVAAVALSVLVTTAVQHQRAAERETPRSHQGLDWEARSRWVHVDNVDPEQMESFVSARRGWMATLRQGDGLLGDGRALFWHAASSPERETFFSFYPFSSWADLEARGRMIHRTEEIVGDAAVAAYDSGDAALVSPHYWQIWRRLGSLDIAPPAIRNLTEVTASNGRIEVHTVDIRRWDEFETAWLQVAEALGAAEYSLGCRAFRASYGRGEVVLWWLASDPVSYKAAPPVAEVLERQLGQHAAAALLATLDEVLPLEESYDVERRVDLSNMGG